MPTRKFPGFFRLFRIICLAATAVCLCPVIHAMDPDHQEPKPARTDNGEPVWLTHPGPWGNLEIRSIYLEAPDALVAGLKQPNSTTAWNFPGATLGSLNHLFESAGLSNETIARLLDPQRILVHEGVWTLFADPAIITAMTVEQRSVIYTELATSPLNPMHAAPAYSIAENVNDWVDDSHLSDEQKRTVKQLVWKDHDLIAFSDLSILLAETKSDAEIAKVFKFMTRVRSLVATLHLPENVDCKALAQYWTAEGRASDIQPLLVSAAERESMRSIDITHLLPPLARERLYTFPTVEAAAEGRLPDCQWTALNFFNSVPRDYYLDARLTLARLKEAYDVVEGPCHYGDILEFLSPTGDALHACVYVADDMVFTKNGDGMVKPWILMWLADVKKLYLREQGSRVACYRLKAGNAWMGASLR